MIASPPMMEAVEAKLAKFVRLVSNEPDNGWEEDNDALTKEQFVQYIEEYRSTFEEDLKLADCAADDGVAGETGASLFEAIFEAIDSSKEGVITKEAFKGHFLSKGHIFGFAAVKVAAEEGEQSDGGYGDDFEAPEVSSPVVGPDGDGDYGGDDFDTPDPVMAAKGHVSASDTSDDAYEQDFEQDPVQPAPAPAPAAPAAPTTQPGADSPSVSTAPAAERPSPTPTPPATVHFASTSLVPPGVSTTMVAASRQSNPNLLFGSDSIALKSVRFTEELILLFLSSQIFQTLVALASQLFMAATSPCVSLAWPVAPLAVPRAAGLERPPLRAAVRGGARCSRRRRRVVVGLAGGKGSGASRARPGPRQRSGRLRRAVHGPHWRPRQGLGRYH